MRPITKVSDNICCSIQKLTAYPSKHLEQLTFFSRFGGSPIIKVVYKLKALTFEIYLHVCCAVYGNFHYQQHFQMRKTSNDSNFQQDVWYHLLFSRNYNGNIFHFPYLCRSALLFTLAGWLLYLRRHAGDMVRPLGVYDHRLSKRASLYIR